MTQPGARFRAIAFGLQLEAALPIPFLDGGEGPLPELPRRVVLGCVRSPAGPPVERLFERRFPDGRPMLLVDRCATEFRVWAPRHGRYVVAADGRTIDAVVPQRSGDAWTRLLFAQVLPLAAALQGLECLHAGAVEIDGRAIALVASSGTGKSSTLLHLVARGATFVTDDVLAVERAGEGVIVHAGAPVAAADPRTLEHLPETAGSVALEPSDQAKTYLRLPCAEGPLPLAAVYLLRREGREGPLALRDLVDPRRLLQGSFLPYLTGPAHLVRRLDVAAAVAASAAVVDVDVPVSASAADVAAAIAADAETR